MMPTPAQVWLVVDAIDMRARLNDPIVANAIPDHVLHAAHKAVLTGELLRKAKNPST